MLDSLSIDIWVESPLLAEISVGGDKIGWLDKSLDEGWKKVMRVILEEVHLGLHFQGLNKS